MVVAVDAAVACADRVAVASELADFAADVGDDDGDVNGVAAVESESVDEYTLAEAIGFCIHRNRHCAPF